ncbi:GSU2403 family nucleotidyltransferase fold protein [Rhizobium jaguaris]|uniref:GSU2403 family nucleotidyltransferase fold protein n=1 Tax=Rhizobium jaguaris TaxID=1312183 RepID=UPI0013C508BA|nr:GSU2403 family nucleotidyltransferase fold protein [Rhizobium jaguaris]
MKADYVSRRRLASQLRRSGLPSRTRTEGEVISQLAKSGLFRLRAVLVGSHAFQTYGGLLGLRFDEANYLTQDDDIAQYHSISVLIDDAMEDIGSILTKVDATFKPIFNPHSPFLVAGYRNSDGTRVEFLTPNRGDAANSQSLTKMPALGGIGAQALPYLDFLIREPVRSVVLHEAGVGVVVPAPERYAVHKLIVSTRLRVETGTMSKITKDLAQASALIARLSETKQEFELGSAWIEAWERGPRWRRRLAVASLRLEEEEFSLLEQAVVTAERLSGIEDRRHGMGTGKKGILELRDHWSGGRSPS